MKLETNVHVAIPLTSVDSIFIYKRKFREVLPSSLETMHLYFDELLVSAVSIQVCLALVLKPDLSPVWWFNA